MGLVALCFPSDHTILPPFMLELPGESLTAVASTSFTAVDHTMIGEKRKKIYFIHKKHNPIIKRSEFHKELPSLMIEHTRNQTE